MDFFLNKTFTVSSAEETFLLSKKLGQTILEQSILHPNFVILLEGNLGAGKTHFVKGLASGLNIPDNEITSPTFTIINEYNGSDCTLWHIDLYRLPESSYILSDIGLDDILELKGVIAIEWSERIKNFQWNNGIRVTIHVSEENSRNIQIHNLIN